MDNLVLGGKLAIGVAGTLVAMALIRWPRLLAVSNREFSRLAMAALVVSRMAVWIVVYVVLEEQVHSDARIVYLPEAEAAMRGGVGYLDPGSSYGPLFPHIVALPLRVWHSAKAIVLLTIAVECLALPVWIAVARRCAAERSVRVATVLYLTSAIAIVMVPINGSNQVWIMMFVGLALLLLLAGRDVLSGLTMAASALAVKVLAGLFMPVLWLASRNRWTWSVGCLLPLALVYGGLAAADVDILQSLRMEATLTTSGNLPFLLRSLGMPGAGAWVAGPIVALALVLGSIFALAWWRDVPRDRTRTVHLVTLLLLAFMVVSQKSYTNYLAVFLFPLCLTVAARPASSKRVALLGAFMTLAALEPSLYFRWLDATDLRLAAGVGSMTHATFLMLEVGLITGYLWIGREAWQSTFGALIIPPNRAGR